MRDEARGDAGGSGHLVEVIPQFTDESISRAGAGQQASVGGQGVKRAEEAEALEQGTDRRVHGDHAFSLQLAERHQNGPSVGAGGMEAIEGKVHRFACAHPGMAKQQQDMGGQIVAAE